MAEKDPAWEGEMFRLLAEHVQDYALFVVDPRRHVLSWGKGAERLLGYTEGEIVGRPCDCFFPPEDVQRGIPQKELEQALQAGRAEGDRWHVRKDGARFWSSGVTTPLRDEGGGLRGFAKLLRDRTELKQAEEAAQQRQRQLQLLTDHAPVLIAHCDADRRYQFANKPYAARFGLHPRDLVGRRIRDVLGESAYAAIERHLDAALRGERVEFEVEIPYGGLGPQLMRCAYDPEIDPEGRVRGIVAAYVNVTEARQAGEALRESERRLRTLSDNLPLGAVYQLLGEPGGRRRFLYVSGGVERLFGITPAEALADANALYGLVHEDDRDRVRAAEDAAYRSLAPFDCEVRSWTRSGGLIWVHARSAPRRLPSGETVWEGIVLDVTDRRRAEEALHRERELLQTIIDKIPVMITLYEPDAKVLRLNPAFERAVGWSAQDAARVSLMEQCYPEPAHRERVREFMQSCRDGWMDLRMRTRDGRDLETSWANVRLSSGTQVGIGLDITDRKRYEEALQEADRRKDEFLAMLAHELRNPLAPIRTAAQVIRLLGTSDANVRRSAEMVERQVQHLTRLVDDLLDVSRITRGKIKLRKEPVELAAVVARAVETARPLLDARAHELTVTLPPEAVRLEADATRLAQVVGNLLANAAKYTAEGGHVWLTAEREGGTAVLRVRDTGVGIPPDMLGKVFDLFTQVDRSLARSEGGLGIGLTLVKNLVELHGGTVGAYSEGPGKGSEFVVRLPVLPTPQAPDAGPAEPAPGRAPPPRRVLVVDDNADAADSLAMLLRVDCHEVRTAHDGPTALETAEWFRPEVVFLDIGLPRMDGYEVARQLRQRPGLKGARLVAVTGYGQGEDRRRAQDAGFDLFMTKPVDPLALRDVVAGANGLRPALPSG
jgi:PAS domain S-box-containing protein